MLVDWFTVGAQALNFVILVWLMKRFLYRPILAAIDAREKRIAAELASAAATQAEAVRERDEFQRKNRELDEQRATLLSQATAAAQAERVRLLDEARQAADAWRARRQETLRSEARQLGDAVARRTQREVFAIARQALADLAGTSLEARMVDVFTRRVRELQGEAKDALAAAPALVRSACDLSAEERAAIQSVLDETFPGAVHVRFETAPDVVSGIELTANGYKVGWSIADYLVSLEKVAGALLDAPATPPPTTPSPQAPDGPQAAQTRP